MSNNGTPWCAEDIDDLNVMYMNGFSYKKMTQTLKRSKNAVRHAIRNILLRECLDYFNAENRKAVPMHESLVSKKWIVQAAGEDGDDEDEDEGQDGNDADDEDEGEDGNDGDDEADDLDEYKAGAEDEDEDIDASSSASQYVARTHGSVSKNDNNKANRICRFVGMTCTLIAITMFGVVAFPPDDIHTIETTCC